MVCVCENTSLLKNHLILNQRPSGIYPHGLRTARLGFALQVQLTHVQWQQGKTIGPIGSIARKTWCGDGVQEWATLGSVAPGARFSSCLFLSDITPSYTDRAHRTVCQSRVSPGVMMYLSSHTACPYVSEARASPIHTSQPCPGHSA